MVWDFDFGLDFKRYGRSDIVANLIGNYSFSSESESGNTYNFPTAIFSRLLCVPEFREKFVKMSL